jgi:hypothetical protein
MSSLEKEKQDKIEKTNGVKDIIDAFTVQIQQFK